MVWTGAGSEVLGFCRACGAALDPYRAEACPLCGRSDPSGGGARPATDEAVAYDLSEESPLDRAAVTDMLAEAGIAFTWAEGFELEVAAADEDAVDRLFEQLPDVPDERPSGSDGVLGYDNLPAGYAPEELTVEALGHLFDVADRLMHRPNSRGALRDLGRVRESVLNAPTPSELGPGWWRSVRGLTERLTEAVDLGAGDDEVMAAARHLRDLLRDHV